MIVQSSGTFTSTCRFRFTFAPLNRPLISAKSLLKNALAVPLKKIRPSPPLIKDRLLFRRVRSSGTR